MSKVSDYILNRLNTLLPLPDRQSALPDALRGVHRTFLRSLVEKGRPPSEEEIGAIAPGGDAFAALWTLGANDLVVLDRSGKPCGAYPITTERTPHRVLVDGNHIYAMCAFDAVSVAPMFDKHVESWTRCPVTGAEIHIEQKGRQILKIEPGADVQIGVWWRDPRGLAARNLCPGIMALRDGATATAWQAGRTEDHEFASVEDAVDVALRFFRPLVTGERFESKLGEKAPATTRAVTAHA